MRHYYSCCIVGSGSIQYRSVSLQYWFRRCNLSQNQPLHIALKTEGNARVLPKEITSIAMWSKLLKLIHQRMRSTCFCLHKSPQPLNGCLLIMEDNLRWVMIRSLLFFLLASVREQSRNACYFLSTSRKGKCSILIGCHLARPYKCNKQRCVKLSENYLGHLQITEPASLQTISSPCGLSHSISISYIPSDE